LEAIRGDTVRPLGIANDPLVTVGKLFRVRGEEYQVWYRQHGAHHPNAGGYHQCRLPAQTWP